MKGALFMRVLRLESSMGCSRAADNGEMIRRRARIGTPRVSKRFDGFCVRMQSKVGKGGGGLLDFATDSQRIQVNPPGEDKS